jgi:hypothetical protein
MFEQLRIGKKQKIKEVVLPCSLKSTLRTPGWIRHANSLKKTVCKNKLVSMGKSEMKANLPSRQRSSPQKYFPQTILKHSFKTYNYFG